jgi:hypothetical protein
MFNSWIAISIILIHWFADFVLQTHWEATNKSKNNEALTMHVLTYSTVWFIIANTYSVITGNYLMVALFAPITFVCHWVTDYFTSRLNSKLWAKGDVHNFFVSVGFDQVLHYVQLFLTFILLTK